MSKLKDLLYNNTLWFIFRTILSCLPLFISLDRIQLEKILSNFSSFVTVGILAMYSVTISYLPLVFKDYLTFVKKIGNISKVENSIQQFETVKNEISSTVFKTIVVYILSIVLPFVFGHLRLSKFIEKELFQIYYQKVTTVIIFSLLLWLFHVLIDIIIVYKETLNQQFTIITYNLLNEDKAEK